MELVGIELEPIGGRLSPPAKSRAQRGTSGGVLVELVGIEPTTSSLRIMPADEATDSKKEHN